MRVGASRNDHCRHSGEEGSRDIFIISRKIISDYRDKNRKHWFFLDTSKGDPDILTKVEHQDRCFDTSKGDPDILSF
jgi:hypothetical protein